jgi:MFS family permease
VPERKLLIKLCVLFFLHGMAMGAWFVPLATVLDAYHLQSIKPYAFATGAIAAFISPLFFGAMADRHVAPVRVLQALAVATAVITGSVALALHHAASPLIVLGLIQLLALCLTPTWGLTNAIVLGQLSDARKQFGPVRAVATLGWMFSCCCPHLHRRWLVKD